MRIDADMQIIETYMQQRNYDAANALADTLPSKYSLEGNSLEEYEMYVSLLNLEQVLDTVRSYKDLTETEYVLLQSIADSSKGKAGAKAKGIITKYFGGHFYECISIDEDLFKSSLVNPNILGESYGLSISCNPNPAKDWIAIDYTLPKNESTGTLRFFNNMGKLVLENLISGNQGQFVWDTRKVDAGQYSFILVCGGFTKSGKITIIK